MSITIIKKEANEFEYERVFKTTQEQLFKVYTNERLLKQWWAPNGWEMPKCKIVLKKDGYWHFSLKCKDKDNEAYGFETWGLAKFELVDAPSQLAYYDYVSDKQGRANRQIAAPLVTMHFVTVNEHETKLHIKMQYPEPADLERVLELGLETALVETYEKLDQLLDK